MVWIMILNLLTIHGMDYDTKSINNTWMYYRLPAKQLYHFVV